MQIEEKALAMVRSNDPLSYDTETTGLDVDAVVCGYVFHNGLDGCYVPVRHGGGGNIEHPKDFETSLNKSFKDRTATTVMHHAAFDLKLSARSGVVLNKQLMCTQVTEGLLDDNVSTGYGLDDCAIRHNVEAKKGQPMYDYLAEKFGGVPDKKQMGNYWQLSGDDVMGVEYAVGDGITTHQLAVSQLKKIPEEHLDRVFKMECELIWYLDNMRKTGIKVDVDNADAAIASLHGKLDEANRKLPNGFNVNSLKQMLGMFEDAGYTDFVRTPKGAASFREAWLEGNELGQSVLEVRRLKKLEGSFINPLLEAAAIDGRVHATLAQSRNDDYGTVTGRLSCYDPNLQAFPKRNKIIGEIVRKFLIPDDGMVLYEADQSQAEPRLFAHYSQDPNLLKGYMSTPFIDIHTMAAEILGISRDSAKRLGMGMLTGMGIKALAGHMDCGMGEARVLYNKYLGEAFKGIGKLRKDAQDVAEVRGYTKTLMGRRSRYPVHKFCYRATSRIIQGSNADISKLALLNMCKFAESEGNIDMMMTIHDSFIWQSTPDANIKELVRIAEAVPKKLGMEVPIPLEIGRGKNWAEASYGEQVMLGDL